MDAELIIPILSLALSCFALGLSFRSDKCDHQPREPHVFEWSKEEAMRPRTYIDKNGNETQDYFDKDGNPNLTKYLDTEGDNRDDKRD